MVNTAKTELSFQIRSSSLGQSRDLEISVLCESVIPVVVVQSSFVAISVKCLLYKCVYIDFGSFKFRVS